MRFAKPPKGRFFASRFHSVTNLAWQSWRMLWMRSSCLERTMLHRWQCASRLLEDQLRCVISLRRRRPPMTSPARFCLASLNVQVRPFSNPKRRMQYLLRWGVVMLQNLLSRGSVRVKEAGLKLSNLIVRLHRPRGSCGRPFCATAVF